MGMATDHHWNFFGLKADSSDNVETNQLQGPRFKKKTRTIQQHQVNCGAPFPNMHGIAYKHSPLSYPRILVIQYSEIRYNPLPSFSISARAHNQQITPVQTKVGSFNYA